MNESKFNPQAKNAIIILTIICFLGLAIATIVTVSILSVTSNAAEGVTNDVWSWQCIDQKCTKILQENVSELQSLSECKLFCNEWGNIWPRPSGIFTMGKNLVHFDIKEIDLHITNEGIATELIKSAVNRFHSMIKNVVTPGYKVVDGGKVLKLYIIIEDMKHIALTLDTSEKYKVEIKETPENAVVTINAGNFFGARHALETIQQLVIFDDIHSKVLMPNELSITDGPVYPYRGILLDTSRNFFTVESIKRILDGMAATKLNRFHWHITDSHSFSFYSKSRPELTKYGTLSPLKVYSPSEIEDLNRYALERGISIIPEFDAPSHVGEGWQKTDLVLCFNKEPWLKYCVEPPCGIFDPTKDELYNVLEDIYRDLFDLFKPDIFHMGGDEVKYDCWSEAQNIISWMKDKGWQANNEGFLQLWNYFQVKAQERVLKVNNDKKLPLILWTSTLTEDDDVTKYLNTSDYIIQVWTTGKDPQIQKLLNEGYRLIISNYDALYFDCGFGSWVGEGNNWCSPYIGWQKVYENSLSEMGGDKKELIIGAEAALWSEQADTSSLDGRLWPRAGALGERLWADPDENWRKAESRMLQFREKLVNMGIDAESLQPLWCYQNEGTCHDHSHW